ncbi:MAG: TonB-dependent receptor plug domain-containing protein, partial [Hyphomicrobiales bacterium]|nr:TonB-dependent receptor plug domain-containing protein [Hyphomicrobiales bacterium]
MGLGAAGLAATSPAAAQRAETQAFTIAPQPLSATLLAFAEQSGLEIFFDARLAQGRTSPGVQGRYTPEQALRMLLADSGLIHRYTGVNAITLEPVTAQHGENGALELRPITLEGEAESGTKSPEGFRAQNSVAATNVDAPLIETPATVNVITRDFLDTIGARRIEEVLQYVPGASAESVNASGTGFSIRGFSTTLIGGLAAGEGSVQIDNYRPAGRRYHFDPALYERIDVLKGSAALLYGTADPGGVVRFVTKKPQFETNYRFEGTLGSFETARGTIDVTGPLGEGNHAAYRLIATGLTSNQSFHGDNDDISFDDRLIINPQLTWRTPGGGELNLSYEYSMHESTFDPGIKRLADGSFTFNTEPFLGPGNSLDRENHIGVVEFTQPIGEKWEILIGSKFGHSSVDNFTDASFGLPDTDNKLNRFTGLSDERVDQEEFRTQLSGQFNTGSLLQHQVSVGAYYFSTD